MSDIPDGVNDRVALMAIAWEIVKLYYSFETGEELLLSNEEKAKAMTDAFLEILKALEEKPKTQRKSKSYQG